MHQSIVLHMINTSSMSRTDASWSHFLRALLADTSSWQNGAEETVMPLQVSWMGFHLTLSQPVGRFNLHDSGPFSM